MTTLHLRYSTLCDVFDSNNTRIVIIKKTHRQQIHNTLIFIPYDVCNIINTYCNKLIYIDVNYLGRYEHVILAHKDFEFTLSIKNNTIEHIFTNSFKSLQEGDYIDSMNNYYIAIINTFMKTYYGKRNYIANQDVQSSASHDSRTLTLPEVVHCDALIGPRNTIFKDVITAYDTNDDATYSVRILNYRQFKHEIVIIKCIMSGISRYYRKK